ncbi:MAG: phosphoribosylglycinamide formyltransferase [Lachnospiraceae bacterium]|nr:phosphoribosylglycinamide formyltransferase [Lachnospiraceae bacterium]MBP5601075.1 phosphoribosylglycinamide formyltransferase [Lachnospiraceae bacterium]
MIRVCVCVSGGGTNLEAIFKAIEDKQITDAQIVRVISNNPGAFALERAKRRNVEAICVSPKDYAERADFNVALLNALKECKPDLIVLAGFLVNVPVEIIREFKNRIINIHPSLIPSFCGKGFYGIKVHEEALKKGVKVSGATVHFVDEGIDTGRIIDQKAVYVKEGDDAKSLQERIMEEAEWVILPKTIQRIASGEIKIGEN